MAHLVSPTLLIDCKLFVFLSEFHKWDLVCFYFSVQSVNLIMCLGDWSVSGTHTAMCTVVT